ncbi:hypothetical protein DFH27DRAFT_384356 [Peziza echinospora]|nr:hypothetical protein DFH27DRAFT_384356 [Peziza echinospora]
MAANHYNLEEEFFQLCLNTPLANPAPPRPIGSLSAGDKWASSDPDPPLTDHYAAAYRDFFGTPSGAPCVYKSGPAWPERKGPEAWWYRREARPVYGHPITSAWHTVGTALYQALDACGVKWTSIDPVAFANAGERTPFCPLLMWIGVQHGTLGFGAAVAAADAVKAVLQRAGYPEIEVAFRMSEVTCFARGPKLLPFKPLTDHIPEARKAFTPMLGLSIAPLKTPHYEGTGALYFRLGHDDDRVALLTAAHVARPPPAFTSTKMSRFGTSPPREEIVALGSMGYRNATNAMMATIGNLARSVEVWSKMVARLGEPVDGEGANVTQKRQNCRNEVEKATQVIAELNKLHTEVTKHRTNPDQRIIGRVLHVEPIVVPDGPHRFTRDWAFIELYNDKIDWATFMGNKIYVGGNLSPLDFGLLMFPHPEDRAGYDYPEDGCLQAFGVVKENEIHQPQHLDEHGEKVFMVVKNGLTTGTTVGRVNGLYSFTRIYTDYGIERTSVEVAILPCSQKRGAFSAPGDSGAIILDRAGRVVALLTGGSGTTDETDITYGTPYWWLEQQIKEAFPCCYLYDVAV